MEKIGMIALLFAFAVEQSTSVPPVSIGTAQVTSTFAFPSELAPAVIPYVSCLSNGMMKAINDSSDGISPAELPTVTKRVKEDCAAARAQAKARGVSLLNTPDGGSPSQQEAQMEDVLVAAEKSVLEPPAPPPISKTR